MEIARGAAYPRISLGANYYNNFNDNYTESIGGDPLNRQVIPFFTQLSNNQRYGIRLNVSIPIFNGFQTRTNVSNAKIQVLENEYRLQTTLNALQKDIEQAYTNAVSARQRYFASQTAVNAGNEAFRYVEQRHNNGLATTVELNQVKNDLATAQSQQLQAKYEFIFRTKILDFYNGVPIEL
jgi:outer membrane protein